MKYFLLVPIKLYQVLLSFDHGLPGRVLPWVQICRHVPSCSEYSYRAVDKYGVLEGFWLSLKRVVSCNPWTAVGTYDPVP